MVLMGSEAKGIGALGLPGPEGGAQARVLSQVRVALPGSLPDLSLLCSRHNRQNSGAGSGGRAEIPGPCLGVIKGEKTGSDSR